MSEPYLHIYKAELNQPLIRHEVGLLATYDNMANRFGVELYSEGFEVDLTGYSVNGYFIRPNAQTVIFTGSVSGNMAYVDLPENCYYYDGAFTLSIKVSTTDFEQTILICDGFVEKTRTDRIVDENDVPGSGFENEPLTFNGAVNETYDGTAPKTVTIPTVPSSMKNPHALSVVGFGMNESYDGGSAKTLRFPYLTVGTNGMYKTIQAAVDAAQEGDTILVAPGIYNERLKVHKNVKILGELRNGCILQTTVEDYANPPLEMSEGEFGNFQVRGYDGGGTGTKAYCLHVENDNSAGSSLYIHDVDFTNYVMQTVGIGMRNSFNLRFDDCTFTCMADLAAFYCHSCIYGGIDQNLYVNRCMFRNGGYAPIIRMQSQNIGGAYALCEWVDCKAIPRTTEIVEMVNWDGSSGHAGWLGSADWNISGFSMGNNIAKLNAWGV